jgi:hypothetical protein
LPSDDANTRLSGPCGLKKFGQDAAPVKDGVRYKDSHRMSYQGIADHYTFLKRSHTDRHYRYTLSNTHLTVIEDFPHNKAQRAAAYDIPFADHHNQGNPRKAKEETHGLKSPRRATSARNPNS